MTKIKAIDDLKKGLTLEEINEAVKSLPNPPKFSDLQIVENCMLPDNSVIVSTKLMKFLKEIFNYQKTKVMSKAKTKTK